MTHHLHRVALAGRTTRQPGEFDPKSTRYSPGMKFAHISRSQTGAEPSGGGGVGKHAEGGIDLLVLLSC